MAGVETVSEAQLSEIAEVKKSFPGRVRVIADVGEFSRVVTVQPIQDVDVHVKLQLTAKYPAASPIIIIRSSTLTEEQTDGITNCLKTEADTRIGQLLISCLIAACDRWLKENDIQAVSKDASPKSGKKSKVRNQNKSKGKRDTEQLEKEEKSSKKPPMKTASDVIKRIQWDPSLDKECFIVGYMDRIVGLVEKKFTAFTWEDLATVDMFSLAIPQHRIQYFKYLTEKVWDKNERLDNVFGSTGSKITIIEAMAKYQAKQVTDDADNHSVTNNAKENIDSITIEDQPNTFDDDSINVDIDLENGSDIEINVGHNEQTRNDDDENPEGAVGGDVDTEIDLEESTSAHGFRPNHFAAFHISDQQIQQNLAAVQDQIEDAYPAYKNYRIAQNCFHVTLAVMKLGSSSEVRDCVSVMNSISEDLAAIAYEAGSVRLEGIGNFSPRVVFARVKSSPKLLELATRIRQKLDKAGLWFDERQFTSHITLFKVTGNAVFPVQSLQLGGMAAMDFGSQYLSNVHVCKMGPIPASPDTFGYRSVWKQEF